MEAWGTRPLENTEARDLLAELGLEDDLLGALDDVFQQALRPGPTTSPDAARAVAAAYVTACLQDPGGVHDDQVEGLLLDADTVPGAALVASALSALDAVRSGGELWDHWEDEGQVSDFEDALISVEEALDA